MSVLGLPDRFRLLRRCRLISLVPLAAIILLLPLLFSSAYYYRVAALVFIFAIAALGLNLLMGFAGQVSLGHAGFMGVGAYAVAIGPTHLGIPPLLSFVLGAMLSALVAFVVGRPILRLKGHYLAVANFSASECCSPSSSLTKRTGPAAQMACRCRSLHC